MKLIVGLGNPGNEYEKTRHNVGFMALDLYLGEVSYKEKFSSLYSEKVINGEKVIFMKPLTFMNNSGDAIRKIVDYFKIDLRDILIIYDDMDFELGTYKLKSNGSSGGHNGIKSIIKSLGTEEIKRLRIGISKNNVNSVDYVLGKFSKEEFEKLNKVYKIVNNIIEDFVKIDFEKLMSKYN